MAYGMGGALGLTFQQSYGTAYTTGMKFLPFISESMNEEIPPLLQEGITGRYDEGDSFEGEHAVAGDIVYEVGPAMVGYMLKGCLGSSSLDSTTVDSYYYQHIFMPSPADFDDMAATPPMTIEIYRDAGSAFQYYDCLINQLTLEYAHGALIRSTASIIGGNFTKAAKQTASYEPFSEFTWNQCSISVAGTAVDEFQDLTVTINNNLEATYTLNATKFPNRIKRSGFRTTEVSGTILFISQAEADIFRAQTERRVVISTVQGSHFMELDIPSFRYESFPVNIGGPGQIAIGFSGKAKYNSGSGTALEITTKVTSLESY
jgi:hypothetical protein